MRKLKIMSTLLILLLVSTLFLGGCSKARSSKEVLSDVFANETVITSSEGKLEMSVKFNMENIDITSLNDPQTVAMMNMLNNAKITMNYATDVEQQKAAIDFTADLGGMAFYGKMYLYDEKLAIQMPFLTQFLGDPRLANGYLVMDLKEMIEMQGSTIDVTEAEKMKALGIKLVDAIIAELDDKALSNKGSSTIEVGGQSVKVDEIQINIGKDEIKSIVLTVVNLLEDKDFRDMVFEIAKSSDPYLTRESFDEVISTLSTEETNDAIESALVEMEEVVDFTKTGIKTSLFIDKDNNVVRSIMEMVLSLNEQGESLEVIFNATTDTWNINQPITLEIPNINENNSIDLFELLFGGFGF